MLGKRKVTSGLAVLAAGTVLALGSPTLANAADGQPATTKAADVSCSYFTDWARRLLAEYGFKPSSDDPSDVRKALYSHKGGFTDEDAQTADYIIWQMLIGCP